MNRHDRRKLTSKAGVLHKLRDQGCDCDPVIVPTPDWPLGTFDIAHQDGCTYGETTLRPILEAGLLPFTLAPVRRCVR